MLITARRTKMTGGAIKIPNWVRAPLYLNNGARVSFCLDPTPNSPSGDFLDAFITPFPANTWGDLWRVELGVVDAVGILAKLIGLLRSKQIIIMAAESTVAANGVHHLISIVISCSGYRSAGDRTSSERKQSPHSTLAELEAELSIYLIEHIRLSARGSLRLKIRRLESYWNIHQGLVASDLASPIELPIKTSGLTLPPTTIDAMCAALQVAHDKSLYYTPSIDTKDRIIRILVFSDTDRAPCYAQVYIPSGFGLLARVMQVVTDQKHNIVRFQLRQGGNKHTITKRGGDAGNGVRLDVTFSPYEKGRKKAAMLSNLKAAVEGIEQFKLSGAKFLVLTGGENPDD